MRRQPAGIAVLALAMMGAGCAARPPGSPRFEVPSRPSTTSSSSAPAPSAGLTPVPGASLSPSSGSIAPPAQAPGPDGIVAFDTAALSADGRTLSLAFTGGKEYAAADPCSRDYRGWSEATGDVLWAAVVDVTPEPPFGPTPAACDAVGYPRRLAVELTQPFTGARLVDLGGYEHFLRAPDGLADVRGLEDRWDLLWEGDVAGSRVGRWQRTWSPLQELPAQSGPGRIDLFQAFGGPVDVTGGDGPGEPVTVNGMPATLYRWPPAGELVLVWSIDGTELALVANQGDFAEAEVIRLAESVALPDAR